MRVLILTSKARGIAGPVLRALLGSPGVSASAALLCGLPPPRRDLTWLRRRARKVWRIGPLGALNGLRLRGWFDYGTVEDLEQVTADLDLPLLRAPLARSDDAIARVRDWAPDLMISLGNPILPEALFAIPRFGTINYHGELLPEYPGAQSVIWPIHFGQRTTGFTIHKVSRRLDGGDILLRHAEPIVFHPTLRATIAATGQRIQAQVPVAFRAVLDDWERYWAEARPNPVTRSFTTPTLGQFLTMQRNNRRLHAEQGTPA